MRWPVDAPVSQAFGSNPTNNIRPGSVDYWIIQMFGNYQPNGHTGIDFPVRAGTPVGAAASGTILHEGWMGGTYADNPWWIAPDFAGICVVIDHGAFIGIYGHMSSTSVNVGDYVTEGEVIGLSGNTGGSTGDHLHFEVLPDGWDFNNGMFGRVNPAQFISSGASMGPSGDIAEPETIPEPVEEDTFMTSMHDFLNTPAYTGGPTISQMFVKVNALHDAVFKNDGSNKSIVGGESLPGLTNKNDLKILEALEELQAEVASLKEGN